MRLHSGRWGRLVLAFLSLPLLMCSGKSIWALPLQDADRMTKSYKGEEFFDGLQLEVAKAIDRNDMAAVRKLATQGANLKTPGRREMDLLWYAAGGSDGSMKLDAVKTLVSLGVDPDAYVVKGLGSVLYAALKSRLPNGHDTDLLRALLDGGMDSNRSSKGGTPLLLRAVEEGKLPHVKLLVERGAFLDAKDSIGGTAFYSSLTTHQPDIGIYLLKRGANFNTSTLAGTTPAWGVKGTIDRMIPNPVRTQFEELRDMMIARGAKWPPDPPDVVRAQMKAKGLKVAE